MIHYPTMLGRNGLSAWLIQRVTALILAAYFIFLIAYIVLHSPLDFATWQNLFSHGWMKVFSFLALLSLVGHSWTGIWTVITDYIKCAWGRLFLEVIMIIALLAYLVWGVEILWRL